MPQRGCSAWRRASSPGAEGPGKPGEQEGEPEPPPGGGVPGEGEGGGQRAAFHGADRVAR